MACFLVPTVEAIAVTVAAAVVKKSEDKKLGRITLDEKYNNDRTSHHMFNLTKLLYGGSALLAFEHLWHGEISPVFPFLTSVSEGPEAVAEMLAEMSTAGVAMAAICTAVWGIIFGLKKYFSKKAFKEDKIKA